MVEHQRVARGVGERGHVADPGVDGVAQEPHPPLLERRASGGDVLNVQRDRMRARLELATDRRRVQHLQGEGPGLELAARDPPVVDGALEAEHVAVERGGGGVVGHEHGDEVDARDADGRGAHAVAPSAARTSPSCSAGLTLRSTLRTAPSGPMMKVDRSAPM